MQINQTVLETVVNEAINKCGDNKRWANAVRRAAEELVTNPYIAMVDDHLLVLSQATQQIYEVNGRCQCAAYVAGQPCKHRAMKRLVELAMAH